MPLLSRRRTLCMTLAMATSTLQASPRSAAAQSGATAAPATGWRAVTVAQGVAHPVGMAWLPDGRALVTACDGTLHVLKETGFEPVALEGMPPLYAAGNGGLLDITLHPADRGPQPRVYMTVVTGNADAHYVTLVRGVLDGQRVQRIEVLLRAAHQGSVGGQPGSRMLWLPDNTLLMSVADGGASARTPGAAPARHLATHLGTILHLTEDGRPAPGNPLAARKGALPEIWTYGHRNVQGLARDPVSGRIWASEPGLRGGDEVNLLQAGQNYSWSLQSYSHAYRSGAASGRPAAPGADVSPQAVPPTPSGLALYSGQYFPDWQGSLFCGSPSGAGLRRIKLDAGGKVLQQEQLALDAPVRDVRQGADGFLYALTDEPNGRLLRLEPV
jgi:glucose/arabinose dehydrogenase